MSTTLTKINSGSVLGSMKRRGYGICTALLLLGSVAQSTRADSLSFSETHSDKLVAHREEGFTSYEVVPTGNFNLRGMKTLPELEGLTIDENTEISIGFGSFEFEGVLGDDPKFKAGKRSAKFVVGHDNDNGKFVKDYTVTVRWNKKTLSVSVTGKQSDSQGPIVADQFVEGEGTTTGTADLTVNFAGIEIPATVNLTAKTTHKTVTKGKGEDKEEFELTKVTVKGKP